MITIPPKFQGRAYVSPAEAAEVLGVDSATFYRHVYPKVRSGRIQSLKVGARVCIRLASLLDHAEREEVQHGT